MLLSQDYCNSLYLGLPLSSAIDQGKEIGPCHPIAPMAPGQFQDPIQFKILLFVFKTLNDQAPSYLKYLIPHSDLQIGFFCAVCPLIPSKNEV